MGRRNAARSVSELGAALLAELIEEDVQRRVVASRSGPDQSAAVMVDHDDQIAVTTLVGDLIDPDAPQPFQSINAGFNIVVDPGDDRPDSAPGDP